MKKRIIAILILLPLLLGGCKASKGDDADKAGDSAAENGVNAAELTTLFDTADMFTDRDYEVGYDESASTAISLKGSTAECSSSSVEVSGSTVTITAEGTYILSGTLEGMIVVDVDKEEKVQLVLDGASVESGTSAAIYILQADKVFLTLAPDSVNTLKNGGTFTAIDDNNIDAVIFSKEDLTLNGQGSLTIESPAGHGIVSKDDLVVTSGTYNVTAASHGLSGKDSVRVAGGTFDVTAGKDGIHAENADDTTLGFVYISNGTFQFAAEGDGVSAGSNLQVDGGSFTLVTGGGSATVTLSSDGKWSWGGSKGGGSMEKPQGDGMMTEPPELPENGTMEKPQGDGNKPENGDVPELPENGDMPELPGNGTMEKPQGDGNKPENGTMEKPQGDGTMTEPPELPGNGTMPEQAGGNTDTVSAKGLKAAVALLINNGSFHIDSADDALHSNGSLTVNGGNLEAATGDDGMHADGQLAITGGSINITKSYEGIEGLTITISGGEIALVCSDDGLNAAGGNDQSGFGGFGGFGGNGDFGGSSDCWIRITGGLLNVNASGDGIDSNGALYVDGGEIYVSGPSDSANGALDYTTEATITGGILVAAGASGMAENFEASSTQGSMLVSTGSQSANSTITLMDSNGKELLSWTAAKSFDCVVISCPEIVKGESYTVSVGDSTTEVTMDSLIYGTGGMGGGMNGRSGGNGGGGMGGRGF